jgi:hypothetical protein
MKNETDYESIVRKVRAVVDRYDYDFGSEADFICEVVAATWPGKIPHHACRVVQELNSDMFAELEADGRTTEYSAETEANS